MVLHLPSFIFMEFLTTKRVARAIVYDGHRYVLNRDRKTQELCLDTNKITLQEYVQGMSAHTNI